jgi:hypothetical protein
MNYHAIIEEQLPVSKHSRATLPITTWMTFEDKDTFDYAMNEWTKVNYSHRVLCHGLTPEEAEQRVLHRDAVEQRMKLALERATTNHQVNTKDLLVEMLKLTLDTHTTPVTDV